ncbi:MAG: dTMP kinase [Chloroflexi bacterium]|nr:dTMP kinase [Chloroflexota bacterium]
MAGLFIVLEGGEGCGKTTQTRLLYSRLMREGHAPLLIHEPGGTPLGEQVRRLLMAERGGQGRRQAGMGALTELLLFSAARAELVSKVLRPALEEGQTVICDRFTQSTVAYQGYGRGVPLETVATLNSLATGGLKPDVVVLLDMLPEDALRRVSAQTSLLAEEGVGAQVGRQDQEGLRRFEGEPLAFHRRVRQGYLEQASADKERWLVVDAAQSAEAVAEAVWKRVRGLLAKP